jgi:two-component system alkaline phosphatase synthesis response regulator PhoP
MSTVSSKKVQKTILVVEDEDHLRSAIGMKLKKEDVNVLSVNSGESALEALNTSKPDLVWLDILLPGMNGLELLKVLRQTKQFKDLKVAIVSVSGSPEKVEKAQALKACDYIDKSDGSLKSIVARVLTHL